MSTEVREFWDTQAKTLGTSDKATAPDSTYRELEIERILAELPDTTRSILDVGCGNGYATWRYAEARPEALTLGIDNSDAMIAMAALSPKRDKLGFAVKDILDLGGAYLTWETIICTRCLINLDSWENQQKALLNMKAALAPNGTLILVENTVDGLESLNNLRAIFALPNIEVRWHNRYLVMREIEEFLYEHFTVLKNVNIGNLYYICSRVLNAAVAKWANREPAYDDQINLLAAKLPSLGLYKFSPNEMWVLGTKP